jgi:Co/Zn/Cd efflux system component
LIVEVLCGIDNVKKVHNFNIWCLTMEKFALSVHLVAERNSDTQKILKEANSLLKTKFKIERTTIQVEYFDESMINCVECKLPP